MANTMRDPARKRSRRRRGGWQSVTALAAGAAVACTGVGACNAIAGVDDYLNVACVQDCGAAADATGSDSALVDQLATADGANDAASAHDVVEELPPCPANQARVTLKVTGAPDTVVDSVSSRLSVATGATGSACLDIGVDSVDLRTSGNGGGGGSQAVWTGVTCRDVSPTSRCRFSLTMAGASVVADIQ